MLPTEVVIARIAEAAIAARPFSLVRCGDGENLCMAQECVMPLDEVMRERWARSKFKGVTLPDLKLRDRLVDAVRGSSIVGVHRWDDRMIRTSSRLKRPLLTRVFLHHGIRPKVICDATVTRYFPQRSDFWDTIRPHRVLLVSKWATRFAELVRLPPYSLRISGMIPCAVLDEVDAAIKMAEGLRDRFDVALVSAGVNALILASEIARIAKRPAVDFGKGMQFMLEGTAGLNAPTSRFAPR